MKPSWDEAPSWAQWLAMDGDGMWFWYASEPDYDDRAEHWYMVTDDDESGKYECASECQDESGIDWDFAYSTKEPRP
jgi:hypothetical protein